VNPRDNLPDQPDLELGEQAALSWELATVHRLPVPQGQVIDAELVTDAEYRRLTSEKTKAVERYRGYRRDVVTVYRGVRGAVIHQRTRTVVRHMLAYPLAGAGVVVRRWRDAHGAGRYERQMRAAEARGDQEALRYWQEAAEANKQHRHDRVMDWARLPVLWVKAALVTAVGLAGLLLVLGVIVAVDSGQFTDVVGPISAVLDAVAFVVWLLTAYGAFLLAAGTAGGLFYLWDQGRRHAPTPAWLVAPEVRTESFAVITEDMVTRALAHCKVNEFNKALKRGEPVEYIVSPREQGGGTYLQVRLQLGVIAKDFLHPDTIERLAGNLGRHKHEVYPQRQPDADARVLDLWIADQGTMDKPAPAWPLLNEGEFDVFRDRAPLGVTMRGEPVEQGMLARHSLTGATSKQGKTAFERQKTLALSLDPTVELRIADLKGDGDWSMFAPRAHTLIEGSGLAQTEATCVMLEDLVAEMQRRYDAKRAQGIVGNITRELSRKPNSGFHPIYAWVDECQELYAAPLPIGGTKDESRAWKAAKRLHDQARAVNIHLCQATQRPTDRVLPVLVREGAHVRCSLYVANYATARMVLADAADMGARPQDLRPGKDAGTVVMTGEVDDLPDGMAFLIVRSHYVPTQAAYAVIDRAMEIMARHGRNPHAAVHVTRRDPLADIATVLGDHTKLPTRDVLHGLVELDRNFYGKWTFQTLAALLAEHHTKARKSNGEMVVDADRITTAITDRDQNAGRGT
jgi:S-DNA-T family DNA segregation ATPase FtsK/SpoIIIE